MSTTYTEGYRPQFEVPSPQLETLSAEAVEAYKIEIKDLLSAHNACLIAHYYVDPHIQALAEATGGFVGDSLEMAKFGAQQKHPLLIIAGVKFMGETAKILSPNKTILMPTLKAECSLDLGCPEKAFVQFKDEHPDRVTVVYANTSAAIKANADWVVTSSIALDVVVHLKAQGRKILWAPDRHLGSYIQQQTDADLITWDGDCIVHDEFQSGALATIKNKYADAAVLVHPESPQSVIALADVVGSTSQLLKATKTLPHKQFIVATESGIFYKMKQSSPDKQFIQAPTTDKQHCQSCGHCPWMKMNTLALLKSTLIEQTNEIHVAKDTLEKALIPLQRMIDFSAS